MDIDVVIIGGGVVGLACAAESSRRGLSTLLVERHPSFGQETSSHNSEVIHSGIYYPTGSLRARLCVTANRDLYPECERLGVWTRRCGKLIVAVEPEEEPALVELYERGLANGVPELTMLSAGEAERIEPNIRCRSAIHLPTTGIIDTHELMKAFYRQGQSCGAMYAFGVEFMRCVAHGSAYTLELMDTTGSPDTVSATFVINSAGIRSGRVAEGFGIDETAAGYKAYPNRGHYYRVSAPKSRLVSRLVYPVPHPTLGFLGIHITVDRAGQVKLGPDQEYIDSSVPEDAWYRFDDSRREKFFRAVARYFPSLEPGDLTPDQIGVRPKIQAPDAPPPDFIIREESSRGLPGLVDLIGIESPGLTCAREIAKEALSLIAQ